MLPFDKILHDLNAQECMKPHHFLFLISDPKFHRVSSNSKNVSPLTGAAEELIGESSLSDSSEPSQQTGNLIPNVCSYPQKNSHAEENGTVSTVNVWFLGLGTANSCLMHSPPLQNQTFKHGKQSTVFKICAANEKYCILISEPHPTGSMDLVPLLLLIFSETLPFSF